MNTPSEIIEFVGADNAARALGVQLAAVRLQARRDKLPAMWYHTLECMAGRPLRRDLFTFKRADDE